MHYLLFVIYLDCFSLIKEVTIQKITNDYQLNQYLSKIH